MIYKNKINLEGKDVEDIKEILINSYQHLDTLYILPKDCLFMFSRFPDFEYIGNWDTSNVKDMSYMFFGSEFINDISKWNINVISNFNIF